jgi:glycosyltransferase involved in cell wall biosynthesis
MPYVDNGYKQLKILLYVDSFLPNIGGKEIVVYNIAKEYRSLGHNVRIVGPAGLYSNRKYNLEFPIHRCPNFKMPFQDYISLIYLLFDIIFFGCDILHAHNTNPNGYIAAMSKKIINFPLIITPHGSDIHTIPGIKYGQMLDNRKRKRIAYALMKSDIFTAISNSVRDSLVAAGASIGKVRMVPNGVNIERFSRFKQGKLKLLNGLSKDEKILLTVGNYRECKGFENIIKAMPAILKVIPDAKCIIVGRNNEVLKPLIKDLGLEKKVIIKGPVKYTSIPVRKNDSGQDELASIFALSTIYISAGIDEGAEGMSLALLEAMASNLPIIATSISGNRDIIEDGINGILVKPSCIEDLSKETIRLLKNKSKRDRMTSAQKDMVEQYGWNSVAKKYIEVYEEAIYSHKKRYRKMSSKN